MMIKFIYSNPHFKYMENSYRYGNIVPSEDVEELKQVYWRDSSSIPAVTIQAPQSVNISKVFQPNRYISISKLVTVTALVLNFINRTRGNPGRLPKILGFSGTRTVEANLKSRKDTLIVF